MNHRFIAEYANWIIRTMKEKKQSADTIETAQDEINRTVKNCRHGFITVPECMRELSRIADKR